MNLPKLTKQQQQMLAAGVVGLGGLGFVYVKFFWIPTSARIAAAEVVIEELTKKIATAKATAAANQAPEDSACSTRRLSGGGACPRQVSDILVTVQGLAEAVLLRSLGPAALKGQTTGAALQRRGPAPTTASGDSRRASWKDLQRRQRRLYGSRCSGFRDGTFTLISYQYKG